MIDWWVMEDDFHAQESAESLPLFPSTWSWMEVQLKTQSFKQIENLNTLALESLVNYGRLPGIEGFGGRKDFVTDGDAQDDDSSGVFSSELGSQPFTSGLRSCVSGHRQPERLQFRFTIVGWSEWFKPLPLH